MNERVGARSWLAHSQADYARLARARVDGALAEELLEAAIATYRELGMDSHESNAVALARASR